MQYTIRSLDVNAQIITEIDFPNLRAAYDAHDSVLEVFRQIVRGGLLEHITVQIIDTFTDAVIEESTLTKP